MDNSKIIEITYEIEKTIKFIKTLVYKINEVDNYYTKEDKIENLSHYADYMILTSKMFRDLHLMEDDLTEMNNKLNKLYEKILSDNYKKIMNFEPIPD